MCKNCKKNTIMEFIPTKKKSKGHKVIKAVMAVIAINGALKLYSMYRENKDNEKGKNEGNEVKVYKAYMSGVDLDLRNAIITEDIFITCKSIMSGISIRVPHGVNVELDGKCVLGSMDSSVPEALEKVGPTVYVDANLMLSGLAVQAGKKQSKDSEKTNEEDSIFEEESFEESLEEIQEESEQDLKEASSEESEENTSE